MSQNANRTDKIGSALLSLNWINRYCFLCAAPRAIWAPSLIKQQKHSNATGMCSFLIQTCFLFADISSYSMPISKRKKIISAIRKWPLSTVMLSKRAKPDMMYTEQKPPA